MKKLYVLFFIAVVTGSCCLDRINNCVTLNGTTLTAYNNEDSTERVAGSEAIVGEALLLKLKLDNTVELCSRRVTPNPFITSAYASNCKQSYKYTYKDSIKYISITADQPFDPTHGAGEELLSLFYIPKSDQLNSGEDDPVFDMYLMHNPAQDNNYVFTVTLHMGSGDVIEVQAPTVNLTR